MQGANLLKRRLKAEVEPRSCRPKRLCLEAELRSAECPMETSQSVSNQQQEEQVGAARPRPPLCCPRCLGGEPGHISHITGP